MVQPLTPSTLAAPGAAGSWYQPHPTEPPPRDPPRWWSAAPVGQGDRKRVATELVAMMVLIALPGLLIGIEGIGDPRSVDVREIGVLELLASLAGASGGALLAAQLLWRDGLLGVAGFHRRKPGMVLGYGLLGLILCYLALIVGVMIGLSVYAAFGGDIDAFADELESSTSDSGGGPTIALLAVAYIISISAGITEEIIFRAYAITRLEQLGWGKWAAIGSAGIFTLLHLYQGVIAVFGIGAITIVFTFLYKWKRTLLPVMLAHALYDAAQLTIAILAR